MYLVAESGTICRKLMSTNLKMCTSERLRPSREQPPGVPLEAEALKRWIQRSVFDDRSVDLWLDTQDQGL